MQKLLKFLVEFLSKFIKEEPTVELKESDEPANELLVAVCASAIRQGTDNVLWNAEDRTLSSTDKKDYEIWFDKKDNEWHFRRTNANGTHTTTSFDNSPANRKVITDTISELSSKAAMALLEEFKSKH